MTEHIGSPELLDFFKALADANRLKIIGLLAKEPLSVEDIAKRLNLHSSTASHHLAKLSKVGLVSARAEGYYSIYRLETKVLEEVSQRLRTEEIPASAAAATAEDAYDRKVLSVYLDAEGRIKQFPMQRKKFEVILRHVVESFEPGVRYSEKRVKEILREFNEDTARLRRSLVDFGLMKRQGGGGEYWREASPDKE